MSIHFMYKFFIIFYSLFHKKSWLIFVLAGHLFFTFLFFLHKKWGLFFLCPLLSFLAGGAAGYCLRVRKIFIIPFYMHSSLFLFLTHLLGSKEPNLKDVMTKSRIAPRHRGNPISISYNNPRIYGNSTLDHPKLFN